MRKVECYKCGALFEVEDDAEWGYCPMCENDQVEVVSYKNQVEVLKKALYLACERIKYFEQQQDLEMGVIEFFGQEIDYDVNAIVEDYIEQAKEMLKSE